MGRFAVTGIASSPPEKGRAVFVVEVQMIDPQVAEHVVSSLTVADDLDDWLRTAIEQLPDAVSVFRPVRDPSGEVVDFCWIFANSAAGQLTGMAPGDLVGRRLLEVSPGPRPIGMIEGCRSVVDTGQPWHAPTVWCNDVRAHRRAYDVRATGLRDGLVVVTRDVTELRDQAEALARHRADLRRASTEVRVLNELGDLLQECLSAEEAHPVVARACEVLFPGLGGALSIAAGDQYETVAVWGDDPVGAPVFGPADCWGLRVGRSHVSDLRDPRCRHLDNATGLACLCVPLSGRGEKLGVLHLFRVADDDGFDDAVLRLSKTVSRQIWLCLANLQLRDELRDQSVRDPLTGLFNRRYLEETLRRDLARVTWSGTSIGIIQIDIDFFDAYNQANGTEAGDAVLKAVADVLVRSSRVSDVACRYGGGVFTLVLPDAPPDVTGARAEELRQRIEDLQVRHRQTDLPGITVSCGVASGPEHGDDADTLLLAVSDALREVKRAGRNGVIRASG